MNMTRTRKLVLAAAILIAATSMAPTTQAAGLDETSWQLDARISARLQGSRPYTYTGPVTADFYGDGQFLCYDDNGFELLGAWSTDDRGRISANLDQASLESCLNLLASRALDDDTAEFSPDLIKKQKVTIKATSSRKGDILNFTLAVTAPGQLTPGDGAPAQARQITFTFRGKGFHEAQDPGQQTPQGVAGTLWSGTANAVAAVRGFGAERARGSFDLVFGPYDQGDYLLYEGEFALVDTEFDDWIYGTYTWDGKQVLLADFEESLIEEIMDELSLYGYEEYVELDFTAATAIVKVKPGKSANVQIKTRFDLNVTDGYQSQTFHGTYNITGKATPQ